MKLTHIAGSPRVNGNSIQIAEAFCEAAKNKGAEVNSYIINKMNVQGCQGCLQCKTAKDRCVIKDDLSQVLDDIYTTDIVLLSTPVYFGELTAQMKLFIDRAYSFGKQDWQENPEPSRLPKGKKLVFIQSQDAEEKLFTEIYEKYSDIFKKFGGFSETYLIKSCGPVEQQGQIKVKSEIFDQAKELANNIV